ncbi:MULTISPECIES: copper resistance protein NlpE [Weeksella]|uniref:Copper resistance lipoprotein NlpE n=1 Tax=Weeksella virosa (strain ATCC 43766 / DSM 16922 / JCM 21250 / CCUG 30538 / CDC 9751 / IAM 14551 / NBRC 16016 / NCTC 11634 / CL345/78) TaxID=865938 RepID=F0NZA4_WEEVC|nr:MULTISPECIES: copper resistance protein NlpE [Weeksella]ADX67233.1 copper resistance lipoprotein NlpE [Weeksella virosa DSM 16922]MDK7375042.1 copper resistance protein NlpE [Weeksella virosa]MDK7675919.1 copper resistance protein NlpE [Weeksella virosa]OFM81670.1 hypothetical protein HMPREF2660_00160 [Weeksella sp. HMSC059D05]SUP53502.1 Copper homeostasis protein CutF [Weeksella virosa]
MKNTFYAIAFLAVGMMSCEQKNQSETPVATTENTQDSTVVSDVHNSRNSVDWQGTYEGTLPCADCPGIKTTIVLNQDDSFTMKQEYLERESASDDKGNFVWSEDGGKIQLKLKDNEVYNFLVGENKLIMLDQDGNEVTGELAEQYILNKK